jgi:hypothetical protein
MLLLIEGFETFGTLDQWAEVGMKYDTDGYYAGGGYHRLRDGRWGGYSLELADNDIYIRTRVLSTTDATLIVGLNCRFNSVQAGNSLGPMIGLWDDVSQRIGVIPTATGELSVYLGTSLLGTTTGAGIVANQWFHIEIKTYCHETLGSVVVKVNEVTRLTLTNVRTQAIGAAAYFNHVSFRGVNSTACVRVDDVCIMDATGVRNNDFLGRKRVVGIFPNAAGDSTGWTPSAGDNYACVDEVNPDAADYVQSAVSETTDLYNFTDPDGVTGGVVGIQINAAAMSTTDGVPWGLQLPAKPQGGTQSNGESTPVRSSSYTGMSRIMETNPETGEAWSLADLNNAQFGLRLA